MHWILAATALLAQIAPIGEYPPLVRIQEQDRCGYIDRTGHIVVPTRYDGAGDFDQRGLAAVRVGNRYSYIDTQGRTVFTLPMGITGDGFRGDDYALIEGPRGKGFVDRTGRIVIPPIYRDADLFEGQGATTVRTARGYGLIDRRGRFVVAPLAEGLVTQAEGENAFRVYGRDHQIERYVDATGATIDYRPPVDWAASLKGPFEVLGWGRDSGYVFAYAPGKGAGTPVGMIDRQGRWALAPVNDDMTLGEGDDELRFILVRRGPKWGFIDIHDAIVIPLAFDELQRFDGPHASAAISEKWGLIDRRGNWALQPRYDFALSLSPHFAAVKLGTRYGVVNIDGLWVIPPRFQALDRCHPHDRTDSLS